MMGRRSRGRSRRGVRGGIAVLVVAAAAVTAVSTAGAHSRATMELHIGAPMALSGTWAVVDEPLLNGIKEAVKEINGRGGVDGVTVKLDYTDFRGDSTQQLAAVQKMLDNGIKVFIASNGGSLGANRLAVTKGAIIAAGSGTDPE